MTEVVIPGQQRRRRYGYDTFRDLTEATPSYAVAGDGALVISFADTLDAETVQAITARMTSTDDTDQAERARLAAALDGGATNLTRMLGQRELGWPVEEPIYPTPAQSTATATAKKSTR